MLTILHKRFLWCLWQISCFLCSLGKSTRGYGKCPKLPFVSHVMTWSLDIYPSCRLLSCKWLVTGHWQANWQGRGGQLQRERDLHPNLILLPSKCHLSEPQLSFSLATLSPSQQAKQGSFFLCFCSYILFFLDLLKFNFLSQFEAGPGILGCGALVWHWP